ncbi:hypothetical protein V6N13_123760 [Hibiscus sabdariffa]
MMVSVEDSSWRSLEVGSQVPTQQIFRHIRTARVQCCRWGRKTREGQTRALATARVLSNPRRGGFRGLGHRLNLHFGLSLLFSDGVAGPSSVLQW